MTENLVHSWRPTSRIRMCLIGCGKISSRHLQVIDAIPELELSGVCDLKKEKALKAAQGSSARSYTDYLQMIEKEEPQLVTISTESGSHANIGINIAPLVKAIVVEKPMALTLSDADNFIETCDKHGVRLFVVKQNRYNQAIVSLHKAIEAKRFGKIALATVRIRWCRNQEYYSADSWRGTWKNDGGVLTNQASHYIDLLQWMIGPVESVKAYTATRLLNIETEDTAVAVLRFCSGALGIIEATTCARPKDLEGSISVLGECGAVVIGGFSTNRIETWNFSCPLPEDLTVRDEYIPSSNISGLGHYQLYKDILGCIKEGRRAMLDGLEGRKSLELINAIYESANTGTEVRIRFVPRSVQLGKG